MTKIQVLTESDNDNEAEKRRSNKKRRQKRSRRRKITVLILIVLIIGLAIGIRALLTMPEKENPIGDNIEGIPVTVDLLTVGTPARPGEEREIEYIVIHETGNTGPNANAESHNAYLHKISKTEALSWHYTVDSGQIYKHLPDTEIGFHAGDKLVKDGGNRNGIGIEMCVNPENDYEQTLLNTAALVRYLMKAYDIGLENVKKHEDFSGKICPESLIQSGRWEEFLKLI